MAVGGQNREGAQDMIVPTGSKSNPKLDALLRKSVAAYAAMPLEKRREMNRAQRKSWVVGEMMLKYPEMSREEAERLYNEVCW
jgi:hypothetical protein